MRVAFVSSGNKGISPIVQAQADSLKSTGVSIDIIPVQGKGVIGYLKFIPQLSRYIKTSNPSIVHAHYSLCGIISSLATSRPVVTSLMGSDVNQSGFWRQMIRFFVKNCWVRTIVKSIDMNQKIGSSDVTILPNGVDLEVFRPMDKMECRKKLGWNPQKKIVLFAADPNRFEKNYPLAKLAVESCKSNDLELKIVFGKSQSEIPCFLNAADLLLLTSKWEGSPNIVKEAMACNVSVVATDVGDVKWLFGHTPGYQLAEHRSDDLAEKMEMILNNINAIGGRSRIIELGIDSETVATRLYELYSGVINHHKKQ